MPMNTKKKKQNRVRGRSKRILCLFFLSVLTVICYIAYCDYREDEKQEKRFEQLVKLEEERDLSPAPRYSKEMENKDWIGWLNIDNTSISYPVMQRNGDGEYYLHRDFDGNYSVYGTPFLDARCTLSSDNCIIYGHNISGGRMFGLLHSYTEESFYKEHPKVKFRSGNEKHLYQIISVIKTDTTSPVYSFIDLGNWQEYRDYVTFILSHSLYQTTMGKQIETVLERTSSEDFFHRYQFLTLSTCRSWIGRDARLLVIAAKEKVKNQ